MNIKCHNDFKVINKSRIIRTIKLLESTDVKFANRYYIMNHANINTWNINELKKLRIISQQQYLNKETRQIKYLWALNKNYKVNFKKWSLLN